MYLKFFEKLLLNRLLPMVENNRLIRNHQFGFRQRGNPEQSRHNELYKG
jgi:hypothetical protein